MNTLSLTCLIVISITKALSSDPINKVYKSATDLKGYAPSNIGSVLLITLGASLAIYGAWDIKNQIMKKPRAELGSPKLRAKKSMLKRGGRLGLGLGAILLGSFGVTYGALNLAENQASNNKFYLQFNILIDRLTMLKETIENVEASKKI